MEGDRKPANLFLIDALHRQQSHDWSPVVVANSTDSVDEMASKVIAGVTPTPHIGVVRVLTSDFLQLRRNALRTQHSASDSEDVRWVSRTYATLITRR